MATSVRVTRAKLMAALRAKHKTLVDAYEAEVAESREAFEPWKAAALDAFAEAIKTIKAAKMPKHVESFMYNSYCRSELCVKVSRSLPTLPCKPDDLAYIDRAIQRLELCPDEVLTLSDRDDYFRYL